jgi:hypothetical protein
VAAPTGQIVENIDPAAEPAEAALDRSAISSSPLWQKHRNAACVKSGGCSAVSSCSA